MKRALSYTLSSYVQCALQPFAICTSAIKLGANRRNIVGQQLPTLLDVTCCACFLTLLHVVVCCCAKFETSQTFSPVQTDATSLGVVASVCTQLNIPCLPPKILHNLFCKFLQDISVVPTENEDNAYTPNNPQQHATGYANGATCSNKASVCTGLYG